MGSPSVKPPRSRRAEVLARASAAAVPELAERVGRRWVRPGSAVALAAHHLDMPVLNWIVGLGLGEPISEAPVDSIDALQGGKAL